MSVSALMSVGTQAVFAAYREVQTTANNIANANTEGYSRQQVRLATSGAQLTGSGWIGRGVDATTVTRASNAFLTQQTNHLSAASGADSVRADMLLQLEKVFGTTESGLGAAAAKVFSAYTDLAAAPGDLSARQAALGRLDDFASLARATAQQIEDLGKQARNDIHNALTEVNGMARDLAALNGQIVSAIGAGHEPNDLLDKRDLLVNHLSQLVQLHTVANVDGSLAVFVSSGENLVLGMDAHQMVAPDDVQDPLRMTLGVQVHASTTLLSRAVAGEGKVAGMMRFQNDDVAEARNRLGQLVSAVALSLNQQQALGLDLTGQPGSLLFHVEPPQAVPATTNARAPDGSYLSSLSATITDPRALQASDYQVQADAADPSRFNITRLSDGMAWSNVASGTEIDGFRFDVGATPPAASECFLLRTVSVAPSNVELLLRNPAGIAAANPITASASTDNLGTLAVAGVQITAPPAAPPYVALTLRFNDEAGNYDITDAGGAVLSSGQWIAGQPVQYDGVAMLLSGLPRTGDKVLLQPMLHPANANGNALSLAALGEQKLVGGQTSGDAFAAMLSDLGVRSQSAQTTASNTAAALARAKGQLSGETGVNLDEEAARLIQYQQSYQAAAKILQTAQTLLDTVIQMVR